MTTLANTTARTPVISRRRLALVALWMLQVGAAGMFILAGGSKLAGASAMVAVFEVIGLGQWFRYLTGAIEVVGGAALLVPALAPVAALALIPTMIGAVATHVFILGGSFAPAAVLLVASLVIAWLRRHQLMRVLSRLQRA